jgi:TetR/AcrR family transcriptional repressor of mexJK operon
MSEVLRPKGRPPDLKKRQDILTAARDLFIEGGLAGLSIEETAARAGVSKVTVYKQFVSKEDLLAELVSQESVRMEHGLAKLAFEGQDLPEKLSSFGFQLMSFLGRPDVVAFDFRMMLEGRNNRKLAKIFVEAGPARLYTLLSDFLTSEGFASADMTTAIAELISLWRSCIPIEAQFGLARPPSGENLQRRIEEATLRFIKSWREP